MAPSTYYATKTRPPSQRTVRDTVLRPALHQLWTDNYCVYGARNLWKAARRVGWDVGRDQVARLMRAEGIEGARRTKRVRTTRADPAATRHPDLVNRDFTATAPNQLWVTDLSRWSAEELEAVAHALNTRPRKTLGWKTPAEAFNEHLLLLQQAGVASTG